MSDLLPTATLQALSARHREPEVPKTCPSCGQGFTATVGHVGDTHTRTQYFCLPCDHSEWTDHPHSPCGYDPAVLAAITELLARREREAEFRAWLNGLRPVGEHSAEYRQGFADAVECVLGLLEVPE